MRIETVSLVSAFVLAASAAVAAPAAPSGLGSAESVLKRVPAEQKAKIEAALPRLGEADRKQLSEALTKFDRHSTTWNSLKWAFESGGAVLSPIAAAVGIGIAGKTLGATALGAMAWGGPAIWAIGAVAGLGGFAALMAYEHNRHWYPKALEELTRSVDEIAARAQPDPAAAAAATPPVGSGLAGAPGGGTLSLLGVPGQ